MFEGEYTHAQTHTKTLQSNDQAHHSLLCFDVLLCTCSLPSGMNIVDIFNFNIVREQKKSKIQFKE